MKLEYDAIIVGGGAAGLAGAAFLCRAAARLGQKKRLLLLEKGSRVGKKLLATGNGTCNLTNVTAGKDRYHGDPALAQAVLTVFSPRKTMDFFTAIGVDCLERADGRVYPRSEQAAAVLDALRLELAAGGVEVRCEQPALALHKCRGGWQITLPEGTVTAAQVLVCTGGAAAPALGGSAEEYRLLTSMGCERTPLFPSIVQLRTDVTYVRAVKGIRVDAAVRLCLDGRELAADTGEVLFTDYGVSGPAVMQISRPVGDWERRGRGRMMLQLDLLPDWSKERLTQRLLERRCLPGRTLEDLLTGLLHKRVGQTILRAVGMPSLTTPASVITPKQAARIAETVKCFELPVTGTKGFGGAQVTAGGISTKDISPDTMMCRRLPGLYAAGEMLDVDGDCGGFNLQFAFSSAFVAARSMAAQWEGGVASCCE